MKEKRTRTLNIRVHVGFQNTCKESFWCKIHAEIIPHWLGAALHPCMITIVDTWFCIHDLIKGRWLEWPSMYPKNHDCITCINLFCITCINLFIAYHKNDLEVLMVTMVCSVSKSDYLIERYRTIKFARSTYIVSR